MAFVDVVTKIHKSTKRNYLERGTDPQKARYAEIAGAFGFDYWDGERKFGYGGYNYDGRWRNVAEALVEHYGIKSGDRVLDIGCGKGFLLYEMTQVVPGLEVVGIDISEYAIRNSKPEVRPHLQIGNANRLNFPDQSFDFALSLNTLHNLKNFDLFPALKEIERVALKKYLVVESYRTEAEKVNLLNWQLTCRAFHSPEEWEWLFKQAGYSGDYGFTFFESEEV